MNIYIPKAVPIFLLALIIFSFGIWVGRFFSLSPIQTQKEIQGGNEKESVERSSVLLQYSDTSRVARVIDGDTIELENGERVRYIGIDAPETSDPRKSIQCFGIEAAKKNQELVEGKVVRLEKDVRTSPSARTFLASPVSERDRYQRLLRYVYAGNTFINLELVKQGFAKVATYPPDVKYQEQFLAAEREAREVKKGLWASTCTTFNVVQMGENGCNIKGNISSKGEKIYHLPDCPYYEKTKIDELRGEKWFCDESQALAGGFRKALNCP